MADRGRPMKFVRFTEALKKLLENEENAVFFTDEELVDEVNYGLEEEERIGIRAFKLYKEGNLPKNAESETIETFFTLLKKAKSQQKISLLQELRSQKNTQGWQRFAWLLERKFSDMRAKTDVNSAEVDGGHAVIIKFGDEGIKTNG